MLSRLREIKGSLPPRPREEEWESIYRVDALARKRDVDGLLHELQSREESGFVRAWAAHKLSKVREERAFRALIAALADEDVEVRTTAAHRLSRFGSVAVDPLTTALNDDVPLVRLWAAASLGKLRARQAVPLLVRGLNEPHPHVRCAFIFALGRTADPDAIPAIRAAQAGMNRHHRRRLRRDIRRIRTRGLLRSLAAQLGRDDSSASR